MARVSRPELLELKSNRSSFIVKQRTIKTGLTDRGALSTESERQNPRIPLRAAALSHYRRKGRNATGSSTKKSSEELN